jgi:predicted transcriptional regulator
MTTLAEKIENLPEDLRSRAEGYVDALAQLAADEKQRFIGAVNEGLADSRAGRVHAHGEVKGEFRGRYRRQGEP